MINKTLKFDIFGKKIAVERNQERWLVYYLSDDGKRRLAEDIFVPSDTKEEEILQYLSDLLHEWASPIKKNTQK